LVTLSSVDCCGRTSGFDQVSDVLMRLVVQATAFFELCDEDELQGKTGRRSAPTRTPPRRSRRPLRGGRATATPRHAVRGESMRRRPPPDPKRHSVEDWAMRASGTGTLGQPTASLSRGVAAWVMCANIDCGAPRSRPCVADTCGIAHRIQRRFESGSSNCPEWLRCRAARLGSALQWLPRRSSAGPFRRKSGSCERDGGEWFHPDRDLRLFGEAFGRAPLGDTPLCTKP
jgi:hypothetical protein